MPKKWLGSDRWKTQTFSSEHGISVAYVVSKSNLE